MNTLQPSASTRVLLVEDNPIDVRLLRYALSKLSDWPVDLIVAEDGEKAVTKMQQQPLPEFIVLDLNLPKLSGPEVLQWIRANEATRCIPVAIVSSSPMDEIRSKVSGARVEADCYYTKPMDVDTFIRIARELAKCYRDKTSEGSKAVGS